MASSKSVGDMVAYVCEQRLSVDTEQTVFRMLDSCEAFFGASPLQLIVDGAFDTDAILESSISIRPSGVEHCGSGQLKLCCVFSWYWWLWARVFRWIERDDLLTTYELCIVLGF